MAQWSFESPLTIAVTTALGSLLPSVGSGARKCLFQARRLQPEVYRAQAPPTLGMFNRQTQSLPV